MNGQSVVKRKRRRKPLRNCEVGTPQEAYKRFSGFCCRQVQLTGCKGCYLYEEGGAFGSCVVKWSRMAYRKGGEK